jgi:hypothetical protein
VRIGVVISCESAIRWGDLKGYQVSLLGLLILLHGGKIHDGIKVNGRET